MSTYLVMFRFTQKGIENVKEVPARVALAKKLFENLGANVVKFYALLGQYDTVFIVEAPNEESVAKAALAISSLGNVRSEILRAFTEEEFSELVADLP
jgi:uncharacterized protein with GYD domain